MSGRFNVIIRDYPNGRRSIQAISKTLQKGQTKTKRSMTEEEKEQRRLERILTGEKDDDDRRSLSRTIQKMYDIGFSHEWEWFVTFTFNKEKVDRYNYDATGKKLSKFLNNIKHRKANELIYMVAPEPHEIKPNEDLAWHFHGLMKDLGDIKLIDSGKKDRKGRTIYNLPEFESSLGWTTATRVTSPSKAVSYIVKYITKARTENLLPKGKQRFWASKNADKTQITHDHMMGEITIEKLIERYANGKTPSKINTANVDTKGFKGDITYISIDQL